MLMSHTSAPVPPSLGRGNFLHSFVSESMTARFETLRVGSLGLLHCLTWVNLPPSQMLVPTCSIARTVPLTIGVWSGVSEGKASAIPQAKSIARAIEASIRMILLIPISFFSGAEEERSQTPAPCRYSNTSIEAGTQHVSMPGDHFLEGTSENPVYANFAEYLFHALG